MCVYVCVSARTQSRYIHLILLMDNLFLSFYFYYINTLCDKFQ